MAQSDKPYIKFISRHDFILLYGVFISIMGNPDALKLPDLRIKNLV